MENNQNKSKEQVNKSQASLNQSKNNSQANLNQSKSQSSLNKSVLNQSLKDELNKSKEINQSINKSKEIVIQEDKQQYQKEPQNHGYTISAKSWDLNPTEIKFLNDLYGEIQEAQVLAEGLQQETKFENEQIDLAEKDINTVKNVIDVLNEESDKEDDIRFAIDNALLTLATTKRKTEDENEKLRDLVRERNSQLRMLVIKVKEQEKQIKEKDEKIKLLENQTQVQAQSLRQLQNKVEDEHRIKVVQEQLRKPRDNKLYEESKYVDANARDDPFDFWQNNAPKEYPGEPKKLNEVITKKALWVAQKEDDKLNKFEYQKLPKSNESNFWGN